MQLPGSAEQPKEGKQLQGFLIPTLLRSCWLKLVTDRHHFFLLVQQNTASDQEENKDQAQKFSGKEHAE